MIRVLITGENSYIGTHIEAQLASEPACFQVSTRDMRDDWSRDFSDFDAVVHVAGIAHQKENEDNAQLYYEVNRDLAVQAAKAAKESGVSQFVFLSSMSVFGMTCGRITMDTKPAPTTHYGKSKLEAEEALQALADDGFHMAVLRPPMIYGANCKGNYPRLSRLAQRLPVFPSVSNERSMLYIGTLAVFISQLLKSGEGGCYHPQNNEYVSTDALVRQIAAVHHKRIWQPKGLGWLLAALCRYVGIAGKVFGTLTYDQAMSEAFRDRHELTFAQTIALTEVAN